MYERNEPKGEILVEKKGNVVVFIISGVLEIMQSLSLEETIAPYLKEENPCFVFELSGVNHLSSSGIRVFISTLRQLNNNNGKMLLCNLSIVVRRMLEAVELFELFGVVDNLDDAVKKLS